MANFRNAWRSAATFIETAFPAVPKIWLHGTAPVASDEAAETQITQANGYSEAVAARSRAVRAQLWNVLMTPMGFGCSQVLTNASSIMPPVVSSLLLGIARRADLVLSYAPVGMPCVNFESSEQRSLVFQGRGRALGIGFRAGSDDRGAAVPEKRARAILGLVAGPQAYDSVLLEQRAVVIPSIWVDESTPFLQTNFPAVVGCTWIVVAEHTWDPAGWTELPVRLVGVRVPEIFPGCTHAGFLPTYTASYMINGSETDGLMLRRVRCTPAGEEFVRRFLTRRNTSTFTAGFDTTTLRFESYTEPDATALVATGLSSTLGGAFALAGWRIGQAYLAGQPEFVDCFGLHGSNPALGSASYTMAGVGLSISYPSSVLQPLNAQAFIDNPSMATTRVYSASLPTPYKPPARALEQTPLYQKMAEADENLREKEMVRGDAADEVPRPLTFGQAETLAEGRQLKWIHVVTHDHNAVTALQVTGTMSAPLFSAYSGINLILDGLSPEQVAGYVADGLPVHNQGLTAVSPAVPDVNGAIANYTGSTVAELQGVRTAAGDEWNLKKSLPAYWAGVPWQSDMVKIAASIINAARDMRQLDTFAVASTVWASHVRRKLT